MKQTFPKNASNFSLKTVKGSGAEYIFKKNGLRVLLFPKHNVPIVTVMITYHVGSRNEHLGTTGSTHILEHMMFKGSKNFDPSKGKGIGDVIESTGAMINATTWNDRTNYYEVLEQRHLLNALHVEADRMVNLLLKKKDLDAEMVVVRNEYERGRNDPLRQLSSDMWSTAFYNHPYHFDTIGIKEDIENVTVEKLKQFHEIYYWPNNATVTIVGDIDILETLRLVSNAFGSIPKRTLPDQAIPTEPEQKGERRFQIMRTGSVNALGIAFKIPSGTSSDSAALVVLGSLMGEGKGSLLHKALVDSNRATNVSVFVSRFLDPGLFELSISLSKGSKHNDVEHAVMEICSAISRGEVSEAEFVRAKEYIRTQYLGHLASFSDFAHAVNESIAMGDWTRAESFPEELESVTLSDVVRVASTYFKDEKKITGSLIAI